MPLFTFKKELRETGLAAVGSPCPNTKIKFRKLEVGYIAAPRRSSPDNKWVIRIAVKKDAVEEIGNCGWKWITIKARFDDEPTAREFINANAEKIAALDLHVFEEN